MNDWAMTEAMILAMETTRTLRQEVRDSVQEVREMYPAHEGWEVSETRCLTGITAENERCVISFSLHCGRLVRAGLGRAWLATTSWK